MMYHEYGKQMNDYFLDTKASLLNFLNYKIVELIWYSYFNGWNSQGRESPRTVFDWMLAILFTTVWHSYNTVCVKLCKPETAVEGKLSSVICKVPCHHRDIPGRSWHSWLGILNFVMSPFLPGVCPLLCICLHCTQSLNLCVLPRPIH